MESDEMDGMGKKERKGKERRGEEKSARSSQTAIRQAGMEGE